MLIFEVKGVFKHIRDKGILYVYSVDELLDKITNDKGGFDEKEIAEDVKKGDWVVIGDYKVRLLKERA